MENLKDTGKLVGALVIGALVGAALGILFAPDKGSRTRKKLMGGAKKVGDELKDRLISDAEAFRKRAEELELLAEGEIDNLDENIKKTLGVYTNHI